MKNKFFQLAKKLSYKSTHPDYHLGCVITKGNNVVSVGFNQLKTHPDSPTPYKQLHAELNAILGIDRRELEGCTAYLFRQHKDETHALSKPCFYCQEALASVGIHRVYYTTDTGYAVLFRGSEITS